MNWNKADTKKQETTTNVVSAENSTKVGDNFIITEHFVLCSRIIMNSRFHLFDYRTQYIFASALPASFFYRIICKVNS